MDLKLSLTLLCIILLSACASFSPQPTTTQYQDKESQSCSNFFTALENTVKTAGVVDAETARIKSFPYLRVNRFLSDFRNEAMDASSFNQWLDKMQMLAEEGWSVELSNLPKSDKENLSYKENNKDLSVKETIRHCGNTLRKVDLDDEKEQLSLRDLAKVPDAYKTWQRILGLYPITALAFRSGIDNWHEETNNVYAQALSSLPVHGELIRYTPPSNKQKLTSQEVSSIIKKSSQNTLNIPELSKTNKEKLFNQFSPVFEIDTVTDDDRIGIVELNNNIEPTIDINFPTVYRHISYTRFNDRTLLQLNYSIWFPARTKTSKFDLLAGELDGITWRVTLLEDGAPFLFDTIHNCGCYHLFFPTQHAAAIEQTPSLEEPIFIPQTLSVLASGRTVIRIANGTHYIERIYFDSNASNKTKQYQSSESNSLRSLKYDNNKRKSLFGQDGIIKNSQRGERFLFWPMGIPSPGAMRQWGHHATAFVGRRHFDDARLFEKHFSIKK